MLEYFVVFSKSGLVLWSQSWAQIRGDPVNAVIHQVLLEVRAAAAHTQSPKETRMTRWQKMTARARAPAHTR